MIMSLPLLASVGKGFFVVIVKLREHIYSISPVVHAPSITGSIFGLTKMFGRISMFRGKVPEPIGKSAPPDGFGVFVLTFIVRRTVFERPSNSTLLIFKDRVYPLVQPLGAQN